MQIRERDHVTKIMVSREIPSLKPNGQYKRSNETRIQGYYPKGVEGTSAQT